MAPDTSTRLTYEDYVLLPDDGRRHEIIHGEHYVVPSTISRHQIVSRNLTVALWTFVRDRGLGQVFTAPFDIVLSDIDVVQPDLVFVTAARARIITEKNIQGAPDLIIEILSDSTRKTDEIIKRKLYESSGVREYWIADPLLEIVKIHRRGTGGYERVAEISTETGGTVETPLIPGLVIGIAEVFRWS
jgi:Uma2 family endonuclease